MNQALSSEAPARLHSIFKEAVKELQHKLDPTDFDIIRRAQSIQDVLKAVDDALKQSNLISRHVRFARFRGAMANVVRWLDKNGAAIDMVVQSSPQICGLSVMGLIWGGLKFLIIVCPISCNNVATLNVKQASKDFSDSFAIIAATVEDLNAIIPIWDSYERASRACRSPDALMDDAMRDVRIETICFVLEALKLLDRSLLKSKSLLS